MEYTMYPVHKSLRSWVRYFWSYDAREPVKTQLHIRSFADRFPRLIFQDMQFDPIKNAAQEIMPQCYLSGLDTRPSDAFWSGSFSHFGISFYPHALPVFFGISAFELTNLMPDLLLLDKTWLPQQLQQAADHHQRVALLSHYLYEKLNTHKTDLVINDLIHTVQSNAGNEGILLHQMARNYHVSERQLQRRFKQQIGITASTFQRILKFERALELLMGADYGELTRLAYELGYADQSHFIKDFQSFSGQSPYVFARQSKLGSESASFIYTG